MDIQTLPRIETGVVQIDEDWPGVFIRGDNALMGYAPALEALVIRAPEGPDRTICENLLSLLLSSNVHCAISPQMIVRAPILRR